MRLIPLSQEKFAMVDDEDFEWLNQWKWSCDVKEYAIRHESKKEYGNASRKMVRMHRVINKTPNGKFTDHINGNTLDNRRSNLREATIRENGMNRKINKFSLSGYKGVTFFRNRWRAAIRKDGRYIFLGYFNNKSEAARIYNQKAKELFGEFARLNIL